MRRRFAVAGHAGGSGWRRCVAVIIATAVLGIPTSAVLGSGEAGAQTQGDAVWEVTGPLSEPRYDHTTTPLAGGEVLAAAGRRVPGEGPVTLLASAERYSPLTEQWRPTGSLSDARWRHSATLLGDGRVLVAGGFASPYLSGSNSQPVLDSAEIYDPATGTWTRTGSMTTRRALHVAELLPDGKVYVAGGRTCDRPPPDACNFSFRTNTAELYDPATGTWSPTGPLVTARHTTAAALLENGKVLIPAGFTPAGNGRTADLYDPAAGTSRLTAGNLNVGRARQGAMVLDDGRVLVASGFGGGNTSELYDPATEAWSFTGNLSQNRFNFSYAVLPDGKALVAGGAPLASAGRSAELYDPSTAQWSRTADMNEVHGSSSSLANSDEAVVLSSDPLTFEADPAVCGDNCGKVLVAGNNPNGTVELYGRVLGEELGCTITGAGDIAGTDGDDVICGSPGPDRIFGGGGNDVIFGGGGDDQIAGGSGDDSIFARGGADRLAGGPGNDSIYGRGGDDRISGDAGNDTLHGGDGRDLISGGAGNDSCEGEAVSGCP